MILGPEQSPFEGAIAVATCMQAASCADAVAHIAIALPCAQLPQTL